MWINVMTHAPSRTFKICTTQGSLFSDPSLCVWRGAQRANGEGQSPGDIYGSRHTRELDKELHGAVYNMANSMYRMGFDYVPLATRNKDSLGLVLLHCLDFPRQEVEKTAATTVLALWMGHTPRIDGIMEHIIDELCPIVDDGSGGQCRSMRQVDVLQHFHPGHLPGHMYTEQAIVDMQPTDSSGVIKAKLTHGVILHSFDADGPAFSDLTGARGHGGYRSVVYSLHFGEYDAGHGSVRWRGYSKPAMLPHRIKRKDKNVSTTVTYPPEKSHVAGEQYFAADPDTLNDTVDMNYLAMMSEDPTHQMTGFRYDVALWKDIPYLQFIMRSSLKVAISHKVLHGIGRDCLKLLLQDSVAGISLTPAQRAVVQERGQRIMGCRSAGQFVCPVSRLGYMKFADILACFEYYSSLLFLDLLTPTARDRLFNPLRDFVLHCMREEKLVGKPAPATTQAEWVREYTRTAPPR